MSSIPSQAQYQDLSVESRLEQQRHQESLRQFETKKRARSILVPTAAEEVKAKLRELGHPVTLFGEDNADRRNRLREVIAYSQLNEEEANKLVSLCHTYRSMPRLTTLLF